MAATEIEKLERRYAENPQGLTFAPLAEVHRKNGEVARALELLRAGLELHPNYIPASIVLGRCHWDQGDLPAAEAAFSHVLRLDDENVIALKSLADVSERLERFTEAQVEPADFHRPEQRRGPPAARPDRSCQAAARPGR
jgi:tetratricopeptide (TPR) repeat protein